MKLGRRRPPSGRPPPPAALLPACPLGLSSRWPSAALPPFVLPPFVLPLSCLLLFCVRPTPTTKLSACLGMVRGPAAVGLPSTVTTPRAPMPVMASLRRTSSASEMLSFGFPRPLRQERKALQLLGSKGRQPQQGVQTQMQTCDQRSSLMHRMPPTLMPPKLRLRPAFSGGGSPLPPFSVMPGAAWRLRCPVLCLLTRSLRACTTVQQASGREVQMLRSAGATVAVAGCSSRPAAGSGLLAKCHAGCWMAGSSAVL